MPKYKEVAAMLYGFRGPLFPPGIERLEAALEDSATLPYVDEAGRKLHEELVRNEVPGFLQSERYGMETTDNHRWAWHVDCKTANGVVRVATPDTKYDESCPEGRYPAVYLGGQATEDEAAPILEALSNAIEKCTTNLRANPPVLRETHFHGRKV